jgi:hypothetical protein
MAKTNAARRRAFEKKQERMRTGQGPQKKGELAEMAFIYKAESLGFDVAKPYGNSNRYDLVVRSGQRFWKVQVKATGFIAFGNYRVYAERMQRGRAFRTLRMRLTFWLSISSLRTHGSSSRCEPSRPTESSTSIPWEPPTEAATRSIAKPGG